MNAADAQWIVVGFLNLACQIAIVLLLAAGVEVALRRYGAGLRALVWTMALASVGVVIGARLASSPITRAPVRFAEARQRSELDWSHFNSPGEVARGPGAIFARYPMPGVRESRGEEEALGDSAEVGRSQRASESLEDNLTREEREMLAPLLWDGEPRALSAASRRRSADATAIVGRKTKMNSWQVAGWGVAALCLVSALLLLRVLVGTLSLKNLILRWRARDASASLNGTLDQLKRVLGMKRRVRLLSSPKNGAPVAFGTFRPTIVLPSGLMERIGMEGVRQMLAHELAHVRRYDSLVILLQRVCMALCFWHPLVHVATRRLRLLIEDACDDYVLRITGEPRGYADCLTKLAEQKLCRLPAIAGWIGTRRKRLRLERRVQKILDRGRPIARVSAGAAMVIVVAAVLVSLVSSRIPVFGIAEEEGTAPERIQAMETKVLKPLEGETPLEHARRLLMEGYARPAIEVLRRAIQESKDPSTTARLRYELAGAYHLLADTHNLEKTLSEIWATIPADAEQINESADFCIDTGQEALAKEAIERLQEMEPDKRVYYAGKLYGSFPKREELLIPIQPKPLERVEANAGERTAVVHRERLAGGRVAGGKGLAADLDGDGSPEILVSGFVTGRPLRWFGVFSSDGQLLWKEDLGESSIEFQTFDVDGDGNLEVVTAGYEALRVYDHRGHVLWERSPAKGDPGWYSDAWVIQSPQGRCRIIAVGGNRITSFFPDGTTHWENTDFRSVSGFCDVNGDGWDEIITRNPKDGTILALDQRGNEIPGMSLEKSKRARIMAVHDMNADGKAEILVKEGGAKLVAYHFDGEVVWEVPFSADPERYALFAVGDLDGDGKKEFVYTPSGGELAVRNADGSTRLKLPLRIQEVGFGDLDGDGKDELLVATQGKTCSYLLSLGGKGELRWRFPTMGRYGSRFSVTPAASSTKRGFVFVYRASLVLAADGSVASTIPVSIFERPIAADMDGDGDKDVLSISPTVRVYDVPSDKALWGAIIPAPPVWWMQGASAVNVDGDGSQELVSVLAGHVCIVNREGKLARTKYVGQWGERPDIGRIDFDGDGKDEILFVDARRFLVLDQNLDVLLATLHPRFDDEEIPVILSADIDSCPGDEILVCRDPYKIQAYSTKGHVVRTFRRPSWLPLHKWYKDYVWPRILPPMDVDGDGGKELVEISDRLFVWKLQGELLDTGFNDYPKRNEVFGTLLVPRLEALLKYAKEFGAFGTVGHYLKEAEKEFDMDLYCAACPVRVGNQPAFAVSVFGLLKLVQADGKVLWEVREEDAELHDIGFGDFDGDGEKEIVARAWKRVRPGEGLRTALFMYSLQGKRLGELELEGWSFSSPVFADFDGDGFMEVAIGCDAGIAVIDMTP